MADTLSESTGLWQLGGKLHDFIHHKGEQRKHERHAQICFHAAADYAG